MSKASIKTLLDDARYDEYLKNKEYLKNISWYSLPNKPSSKGFSANDIRRKNYEPVLQLYDWLYEVKGTVDDLKDNSFKTFIFDISTAVILDGKNKKYTFSTYATTEQLKVLQDYLAYDMVKELIVKINSTFMMVHSVIEELENEYKIYGLGLNLDKDLFINMEITLNKTNLQLDGQIIEQLTITEVNEQITSAKESVKAWVNENFVPKVDMKEIEEMTIGNEKITPLTQGGFIQIKTYGGN